MNTLLSLRNLLLLFLALPGCLLAFAPSLAVADDSASSTTSNTVDFEKDVWPIFERACVECHGPDKQKGQLRLDLPPEAGSDLVTSGQPEKSELFIRVTLPADDLDFMPEGGDPLSEGELKILRQWIQQGAVWSEGKARPTQSSLELPQLTEAERELGSRALDKVRSTGAIALPISRSEWAHEANFSLMGKSVDRSRVESLRGLEPSLVWLNLSRTAVGDSTLELLRDFRQLRKLNLAQTAITDAGLSQLREMKQLEVLNLYGTTITDAGLISLTQLPQLKKLYLWQTQVTDAGVAALAQLLPACQINRGAKLEAPKPKTSKPVSLKLPGCCQKAKDQGKTCDHPCCIETAKNGKVCEKCAAP